MTPRDLPDAPHEQSEYQRLRQTILKHGFSLPPAPKRPNANDMMNLIEQAQAAANKQFAQQQIRLYGQAKEAAQLMRWMERHGDPEDAATQWARWTTQLHERAAHLKANNEPWTSEGLMSEPLPEAPLEDIKTALAELGINRPILAVSEETPTVCLLSDSFDLLVCDVYGQMVLRQSANDIQVAAGPSYTLLNSCPITPEQLILNNPDVSWQETVENGNHKMVWELTRGHWPEWSRPGWYVAAQSPTSEALVHSQSDPFGTFMRCLPPEEGWEPTSGNH